MEKVRKEKLLKQPAYPTTREMREARDRVEEAIRLSKIHPFSTGAGEDGVRPKSGRAGKKPSR